MDRQQEYKSLMLELEKTPDEMMKMSDQTKTRARKRNIIRYTIVPMGAFVAMFFMIMVAVNISPTVTYAFERIPVLRQIATAVNFSPSLSEAIEHEFIQRIDLEQTINSITMRVEYVIVDQRQLNIFYTLNSHTYSYLRSHASILCAEERHHLPAAISFSSAIETGAIRKAVVDFFNEQVPSKLILEMRVGIIDAPQMVAVVPTPVYTQAEQEQPEIAATFVLALEFDPTFTEQGDTIFVDQELEIDGQRLTLTTVDIYPTQMRVNFSADPNNTAWLKGLRFFAESEYGDRFDSITSGVTAFGAYGSPMMKSHILHSPFFAESNYLTLFIEEVVWLDKELVRTRIDLANGTAEKLPEGVTLYEARRDGVSWHLSFAIIERAEGHSHQVFGGQRYFDEAGNEYWMNTWRTGMRRGEFTEGFVPGVFFEEFTLFNFPYDIVYLSPAYSRIIRPDKPIAVRVR